MDATLLYLIYLSAGLLTGGLIGYLLARLSVSKSMKEDQNFVSREMHDHILAENTNLKQQKEELEAQFLTQNAHLAKTEAANLQLQEKLREQHSHFQQLQQQAHLQFEQTANRILDEKTQKFSQQNQSQLNHLLQPLKEKIKEFEEGIERKFLDDAKEKMSLREAIFNLKELNTQLSEDANRLVNALKGDTKFQGNWGEFRLELLLEKAGLNKEVHYQVQSSFKDAEGRDKRPDFIIQLPEDKQLIVDSKVSLTAYERFFHAETPAEQQRFLKEHLQSLRQHVKDLSRKNYQQLYQINTPDYLLLFVPIEPAFLLAQQEDPNLFLQALDQNVVIVTSSTLLATMRTVSFIWKQEKQKRSVLEIAHQSGLLYDRFVAFVEDLQSIGHRIDQAQSSFHSAMLKLKTGKKPGDTLIGRAERIRQLGARTSKTLPPSMQEENQSELKPGEAKEDH